MKKIYITPATMAKDLCLDENILQYSTVTAVGGTGLDEIETDNNETDGAFGTRQFNDDFSSNWFE